MPVRMTWENAVLNALRRKTRTVAVISGASSGASRRGSHLISSFLRNEGYDVIAVRPERMPVVDLPLLPPSGKRAGAVDAVVVFRHPDAMPIHIREVAEKQVTAVWLPPGTWTSAAGAEAQEHHLVLVMM